MSPFHGGGKDSSVVHPAALCCNAPGQMLTEENSMHTQIVMDATGDTRHHFDANDQAAVAEAEKRFILNP
jgi:hypothetical protein